MDPEDQRGKPVEVELNRNLQTYLQRLGLLPKTSSASSLSKPGKVRFSSLCHSSLVSGSWPSSAAAACLCFSFLESQKVRCLLQVFHYEQLHSPFHQNIWRTNDVKSLSWKKIGICQTGTRQTCRKIDNLNKPRKHLFNLQQHFNPKMCAKCLQYSTNVKKNNTILQL